MRKETVLAIGIVASVMMAALGWLLLSYQSGPEALPVASETPVITEQGRNDPPLTSVSNSQTEAVNGDDETRIILVDSDDRELIELLSEKIIRNDEIVDK